MTDAVRMMHYDPRWRQEFEQTRSLVLDSCRGWVTDVAHVGSTAISGLIARPIIDVVALVDDPLGFDPAVMRLQGINFAVAAAPPWAEEATLLVKPRHGEVTHQVFLARSESPTRRRSIAVRDWLRLHREEAIEFEETKLARWKACEGDPALYEQAKSDIFADIEGRIGRSG